MTLTSERGAPGRADATAEEARVEYRLVRNSVVRDVQRGRVLQTDVCDAHPELLRAARNVGKPSGEECPICEAGETIELRFNRAENSIPQICDGGVVSVMNFGNIFGNYRKLPRASRPDFLRTCVRTAMARHRDLPDEFEAASHELRPWIWPRASLEQERLRGLMGDKGAQFAGLDAGGGRPQLSPAP